MSLWYVYVRVKSCISFFMFSFFDFLSLTNKRDFLVWFGVFIDVLLSGL